MSDGSGAPLRSPRFLAGAVFLALVVAAGVVLAVHGGGSSSPPSASGPGGAGSGGCHPSDTDQSVPQAAPSDVSWSLVHTVALPSSPSAGPLVISGDVASCYAHTPLGAILALTNIASRSVTGPGWKDVVQAQILPGANRDSYITARSQAPGAEPTAGEFAQYAGFHVVSYSPDRAVIELATHMTGQSGYAAFTAAVVWSGGDWREDPGNGPGDGPTSTTLPTLAGLTPWAGI